MCMAQADAGRETAPSDPAQILPLAVSRPRDALPAARAVLASRPSLYAASLAHQAIGIILRDHGDRPGAMTELNKALRLARASGQPEREADIQATLVATLALMGRSRAGLAALDRAVASSHGAPAARVLMRRAAVLKYLGRFYDAHQDLCRALPYLRRAGDTVWEARSLIHRADVFLALGLPKRAAADFARAEQLFAVNGQELEYAKARHSLGLVALSRSDLPGALGYFDVAAHRYDALGETLPDLAIDRCSALLAAGLAAAAARQTDTALSLIPPQGGIAFKKAELLLAAATAALAASGPPACSGWPRTSLPASTRPGPTRPSRRNCWRAAWTLSRQQAAEAEQHLERAARSRRAGPPLTRSVAWLARALQADARGNVRATAAACSRGLDALTQHQMTLGATELRAYGTAHGAELATLAQRDALRRGDARRLLLWSERWRATALAVPPAPTRHDRELAAELEALRSVSRLLRSAEITASRRTALERERRRLETAVQARTRRSPGRRPGEGRISPGELDLDELSAELGETRLVEVVEVDGVRQVIVVAGRRMRLHTFGSDPQREVQLSRFALRRLAHGPPRPGDEQLLAYRGRALESALLGPAVADLGDGPVVVVPSGRLGPVPWTLMPSLRDRAVTVAPSALTWLRARRHPPPAQRRVALVAGPGLATGGAEVAQLQDRYPDAVLLGQGSATSGDVLRALDGAWLAHIAAHGTFRADNPLFSSLQLDDGPLTVHDFERLDRAPYWLVLAGCDSGVAAAVGADELLGLVSSLVPLGAVGIVASVVPVNDLAAVPLMLALHDALHKDVTLPEALLAAREATFGDPLAEATAHSFLALGA